MHPYNVVDIDKQKSKQAAFFCYVTTIIINEISKKTMMQKNI